MPKSSQLFHRSPESRITRWPNGGSGLVGRFWDNGSGTSSAGSIFWTSHDSTVARPGLDELAPVRPFVLVGLGAMSLPAICAAALDRRVSGVSCSQAVWSASWHRSARPWSGVPMGVLAPNILDVGDVGHLAALVAPRPLVFTGALEPEGDAATLERTQVGVCVLHAPSMSSWAWPIA